MTVAINALQMANELLHIVHVVIKVEFALGQGDEARVLPVGYVDLVVFEHGTYGVAQQRGVVTRQRCHDQNHRLCLELCQCGWVV
ncbi:hypothetical protein D3C71_1752430 [compost metagenome]